MPFIILDLGSSVMRVPTIEQILIDVSSFVSQGEEFAREHPQNEISKLMKLAVRLGVDAHRTMSDVLPDLYSIQRHLNKLRRIWVILITRCVMIWAGVIFVRKILLETLDGYAWTLWARTDRLLLAAALFLTLIVIGALTNRYLALGWGPSLESKVWSSFCQYVTMGRERVCCPVLQQKLKKISFDEWRNGVSGQSARCALLRNNLSAIGDDIDRECVALGTVTVGTELSIFAISSIGLNFAPLMAWMESASGVN